WPSNNAALLTGVSRNRSTTPVRYSRNSAKPTKELPNSANITISAGVKIVHTSPGGNPGVFSTIRSINGPNNTRYSNGCMIWIPSQVGLRTARRNSRRIRRQMSRYMARLRGIVLVLLLLCRDRMLRGLLGVAQAASRQRQEHVIQGGPLYLGRQHGDPGAVEPAQHIRHGRVAA